MIRRPPRSTLDRSSAASDVYKRQILIPALVAGVILGMVQAATSINEQTLSFVPKLIVVAICLAVFGGSIMILVADFTREIFARIPDIVR